MSKRVGIITFHRANNYGAALQCYALQETLVSLGYETVVIDYRQSHIESIYHPIQRKILCKVLSKSGLVCESILKVLPKRWRKAILYDRFRNQYLHCTAKVISGAEFPQELDIYIIGSDQMWGLQCTGNVKDVVYFGEFPHLSHSKIYGYAISSTIASLQSIGNNDLAHDVGNFTALSFREAAIRNEVERMTGIKGRVDIDPTFLMPREKWRALVRKPLVKEKYMLSYFLHDGCDSPEFTTKISDFASKEDCIVLNVSDIAESPIDFLSAVAHAHIIVTSSFHAVAFSVIFGKQFYALTTSNGRDIRYKNLLSGVGIQERVIDVANLSQTEDKAIDYDAVYKKLDSLKQNSISYLSTL